MSERVFNSSCEQVEFGKRTGSFSTSIGIITADLVWRLPLDDFWPGGHLAPYAFSVLGAIFGGGTSQINTSFPESSLRQRHYYHGQLDGFFGQATAVAIERFQMDHDLYVKGVIDRQLLLALGITKH